MGGILLATAAFSPLFSAIAGEVRGVGLSQGATGTRAEIELQGTGEFQTLSLSGPDRLVVDLPASSAKPGLKLPAGMGIVKSVRTGQPAAGTLRIVFDLSSPVAALKPHMEPSANGAKLVIEWPGDGPASAPAAVAANVPASVAPDPSASSAAQATAALASAVKQQVSVPAPETKASQPPGSPQDILNGRAANTAAAVAVTPPKPTSVPLGDYLASKNAPAPATDVPPAPQVTEPVPPPVPMRSGMRPLVVAIDAGHGGQDPGAIGPNGKREKDVTLAVARELARQINATPGLKAYLTRDTDVFIPLNRRAVLARKAKADMFVSIHADAAENRSARGSSVFVLSLRGASSQRARWLADKENASDLIGGVSLAETGSTLASVLIDLTQSGQMKASEEAAEHVLDSLGRIGQKRRVEKANFAVLRTSDMPAMLVETGFISNHEEEGLLTSASYQRKLANAVLDGVQTYFTRQPPPGTLFAARAQAGQGSGAVGGGSP